MSFLRPHLFQPTTPEANQSTSARSSGDIPALALPIPAPETPPPTADAERPIEEADIESSDRPFIEGSSIDLPLQRFNSYFSRNEGDLVESPPRSYGDTFGNRYDESDDDLEFLGNCCFRGSTLVGYSSDGDFS